jgi:hypothetical protein
VIRTNVLKSRFESVRQFENAIATLALDRSFSSGTRAWKTTWGRKAKLRYIDPCSSRTALRTALTVLPHRARWHAPYRTSSFEALCLVPYACLCSSIPVTRLVDRENLERVNNDKDIFPAESTTFDQGRSKFGPPHWCKTLHVLRLEPNSVDAGTLTIHHFVGSSH